VNTITIIILVSIAVYLISRLLIADYFRLKEEFVERLQTKMTKGQLDGAGQ
jgi:hypothetical protein